MAKRKSKLKGLNILLGVTGGIAAYKSAALASKLVASQVCVTTIMTENARELICPKTFEALTGNSVFTSMWSQAEEHKISHVNLFQQTDILIIAPATANIIGKLANGICDDLLSTTACVCWNKPVLIAPAMNGNMWTNPSVQWNVKSLKETGFEFVGPEKGRLACGTEDTGRMAEPENILQAIEKIAEGLKKKKKKT